MDESRGRFFAFEGIDGCGKTTQAGLFREYVEKNFGKCVKTGEPSDGPIGSLARQCLTGRIKMDEASLAALFAADRLDHIHNESNGLLKAINKGINVVCDRYVLSNFAYQGVKVELEWVMDLNREALGALRPDCHVFIDVDPKTSLERINKGRFGRELFESRERLERVRDKFFEVADRLKDVENIIVINGCQSVEKVFSDICEKTSEMF